MSFWTDIFIPIVIGPLFIIGKYAWDRYNNTKKEILRNKHESYINKLQNEVKTFYWPFYFHLIENQQLWKFALDYSLIGNIENDTSICKIDETDSDTDRDEIGSNVHISSPSTNRIAYDMCAHCYTNGQQCNAKLSNNQKRLFGPYCMAHFFIHNGTKQARMHIVSNSWSSVQNRIIQTNSELPHKTNLIKTQSNLTKSDMNIQEYHYKQILRMFQQNHIKLTNIIHNYLPIINVNSKLGSFIVKFTQYIKAFEMLNSDHQTHIINPKKQNALYPKKLFYFIEKQLFIKQKLLNETQHEYYEDLEEHSTLTSCNSTYNWCKSIFCCL